MFGHNDENGQSDGQDNTIPDESIQAALNEQSADDDAVATGAPDPAAPAPAVPAPSDDQAWQHPGVPLDSKQPISDVISPVGGFPRSASEQAANVSQIFTPPPAPADYDDGTSGAPNDSDTTHELIDIKQHALSELSPLIDQLDLAPEERFRTLMMMIQASDDEHLVKAAYEAAHGIEDEKVRARALLDIVNEVNYFTQQPEN